jgi:hypothetical protein
LVREIITSSIKKSPKSRQLVAEEMSSLLGRKVTLPMLNAFTSDANEKHRWPLAWTRAFCHVTSDWTLLRAVVERAGFYVADQRDIQLLELGRQYLAKKTADKAMADLEQRLGEESR